MTSTATSKTKTKTRKAEAATKYQMYIDGKFVDAAGGKTFDVYDPATEGVIATCPAGGAADVDRAAKAAQARLLRRLASGDGPGARPDPVPAGRAGARPAGRAGGAGDAELGQADRRVRVRHGRHGHLLRVLRRPRDQDPRRGAAGPGRRGGARDAGADRRGGADHPLELSADDGGVEDRAGAGGRMHRGAQAGGADAAQHPQAGRGLRGGRAAARRGERRHRGRSRARAARSWRIGTSGRSRSPAAPRWAS